MNVLIEQFNEFRNFTLKELFRLGITTQDKINILKLIESERILGYGECISECPETVQEIVKSDYIMRYEPISFIKQYIEYTENYEKDVDPEIVNEIWKFVKENQIIGIHYDW